MSYWKVLIKHPLSQRLTYTDDKCMNNRYSFFGIVGINYFSLSMKMAQPIQFEFCVFNKFFFNKLNCTAIILVVVVANGWILLVSRHRPKQLPFVIL